MVSKKRGTDPKRYPIMEITGLHGQDRKGKREAVTPLWRALNILCSTDSDTSTTGEIGTKKHSDPEIVPLDIGQ